MLECCKVLFMVVHFDYQMGRRGPLFFIWRTGPHLHYILLDVGSIVRFESFRALKLSEYESFRALKPTRLRVLGP